MRGIVVDGHDGRSGRLSRLRVRHSVGDYAGCAVSLVREREGEDGLGLQGVASVVALRLAGLPPVVVLRVGGRLRRGGVVRTRRVRLSHGRGEGVWASAAPRHGAHAVARERR